MGHTNGDFIKGNKTLRQDADIQWSSHSCARTSRNINHRWRQKVQWEGTSTVWTPSSWWSELKEVPADINQSETSQLGKDYHGPNWFINKVRNTNPDTYNWDDAMSSIHKEKFLKAAQKEIDQLTTMGSWVEDHKSNAETTRIVPTQWVFKIKRTSGS